MVPPPVPGLRERPATAPDGLRWDDLADLNRHRPDAPAVRQPPDQRKPGQPTADPRQLLPAPDGKNLRFQLFDMSLG